MPALRFLRSLVYGLIPTGRRRGILRSLETPRVRNNFMTIRYQTEKKNYTDRTGNELSLAVPFLDPHGVYARSHAFSVFFESILLPTLDLCCFNSIGRPTAPYSSQLSVLRYGGTFVGFSTADVSTFQRVCLYSVIVL